MAPKLRAVKFMVIEGTPQKDGMAIALERIAEEADRRTGRLDLRSLGLESLPEELFALTHLRELDLGCVFGRAMQLEISSMLSGVDSRLSDCLKNF